MTRPSQTPSRARNDASATTNRVRVDDMGPRVRARLGPGPSRALTRGPMSSTLTRFVVALASFLALDGVWLGLVMRGFYRTALGPIARTTPDGSLSPLWAVALPVYALLALGEIWFVLPRAG